MRAHEVAVIGAGPAGSAAARLLATWGHDVVLLHRSGDAPRQRRAESIPPSCRKLFAALGLLESVDAAGFYRSTGNTVWWGTDRPRVERFGEGELGYQVEREAFGRFMRAHAVSAGADLCPCTVVAAHRNGAGAFLTCTDERELSASYVLDCSGRVGVIARRGWRTDVPTHPQTVGLAGSWTRRGGWPDIEPTHTLVESHSEGWAWSIPLSVDTRDVTAMVDPQRTELTRGRLPSEVYLAELRKARHLSAALGDAALHDGPWGSDGSAYVARTYAEPPFLLVGDAASFIDPLSSYGIKKALASAWLAAVAVHTALRKPMMTAPAFAFFAAREAEMADTLLEQTRAPFGRASSADTHPFWMDGTGWLDLPAHAEPDVRAVRDDERVQRALAAIEAQERLTLRHGSTLRIDARPVVRGHEVVMEDRLFTPALPNGVRFLHDVDLAGVLQLAATHDDVPALFAAYNRRFPPVALPDFRRVLAVMLAFGVAEDAGAHAGS